MECPALAVDPSNQRRRNIGRASSSGLSFIPALMEARAIAKLMLLTTLAHCHRPTPR